MSASREIVHPPLLQGLKAACKALIRAHGGQEAAAAATGRSQSQLCNYGLPNTADFMPVDAVLTLESATHGSPGHPQISRYLAREAGYALVPLPGAGARETEWSDYSARLLKEAGELLAGLGAALADDNEVRAREARALLPDAADLVRAAAELEAALKARAGLA